jgi:hypothetical protein
MFSTTEILITNGQIAELNLGYNNSDASTDALTNSVQRAYARPVAIKYLAYKYGVPCTGKLH